MNMFDIQMDEIIATFEEVDQKIAEEKFEDLSIDEIFATFEGEEFEELSMDEILYYERLERLENEWEDAGIALGLELNR